MPLPGGVVEPSGLPPSPLALRGDVEVDAGTNTARLTGSVSLPDVAPGEQLGRQIDAVGSAPAIPLTGLEQGENQRRNTVFDLALTGGTGSGTGGIFTPTDIVVPANTTQVRVRATSLVPCVIAGFASDKRDGHQLEWVLDLASAGAPIVFLFDSLESPAVEAFLFPVRNLTDTIKLQNFLDSFTWRNMAALSSGSQHWVLIAQAQTHDLNRQEYVAGIVNIHDGTSFEPRQLVEGDIAFDDIGATVIRGNPNLTTGPEVDILMGTQTVVTRDLAGGLFARPWGNFAGTGLNYNAGAFRFDVDFSSVTYIGGNFIDVVGTTISLSQVNAHEVLCRQSAVAGDVGTASVGVDQLLGRPGTGVLQGTQVLTNHISTSAVTGVKVADNTLPLTKITDQGANTMVGRFAGTAGALSSLSIGTHSFPAREGGNLFSKSFTSLAGSGLSYNSGTGQLEAAGGEVIPPGSHRVITRNSVGTLLATPMADQSVPIRTVGDMFGLAFGTNAVLRRSGSGNLGAGTLVEGNYSDNSVTAVKVNKTQAFTWTGSHQFGNAFHLNGVQTNGFTGGTTNNLFVGGGTNVMRLSTTADQTITGLDMDNVGSGRLVLLYNVSTSATDNLIFPDQSASSSAANRFALGSTSVAMRQGRGVFAWHDAISNRVRLAVGPTNTGTTPQGV